MDVFELNKPYELNDNNGIRMGNINYKIIKGINPFILSAPHAVRQFREDRIKAHDILTGGIVEYASRFANVNGIIRTFNMYDDPNYDDKGYGLAYKNAMSSFIRNNGILYLFDVHGCKDYHNFDICIGTNNGANIGHSIIELEIIKEIFSRIGKVSIDSKFKAANKNSVSNYVHTHTSIPCFQFEISKEIRINETKKLLEALKEIIYEIIKQQKLENYIKEKALVIKNN